MIYILNPLNNQSPTIYGLFDGNTGKLPDGITTNPTPTYINNGTGTVKVYDPSGALVVIGPAGATSTDAIYVAGTNGNYRFLITSVFNPPLGTGYRVMIDLTAAGGFVGHWDFPAVVEVRKTLAP